LEIFQTVGATVLAITPIYNNDWMRNSGDQMNAAECQLAGNCQPAHIISGTGKIPVPMFYSIDNDTAAHRSVLQLQLMRF